MESESFKLREQLKATSAKASTPSTLKSSSSKAKVAPTRTKARSVTSKSLNSADDLNSQQSFRRGKSIRALRSESLSEELGLPKPGSKDKTSTGITRSHTFSEFHHPKNASGKNKDGSSKKQMWTTESWKGLEAGGRTDTAAAALAAAGKSGKGKRTAAACCVS